MVTPANFYSILRSFLLQRLSRILLQRRVHLLSLECDFNGLTRRLIIFRHRVRSGKIRRLFQGARSHRLLLDFERVGAGVLLGGWRLRLRFGLADITAGGPAHTIPTLAS